jgi:hypothetical protein
MMMEKAKPPNSGIQSQLQGVLIDGMSPGFCFFILRLRILRIMNKKIGISRKLKVIFVTTSAFVTIGQLIIG